MKNLIIIGAGSFGREVLHWAWDCDAHGRDWKVGGFIDDNLQAVADFDLDVPVINTVKDYQPQPADVFVCAVGIPKVKKHLVDTIAQRGGQFINVIHPSVIVAPQAELGVGIVLCPRVTVSCNTVIGDHVGVNVNSVISHDAKIEAYAVLSNFCDMTGKTTLKEGAFMGSHATLLPSVCVGQWAVVGAGAVAIKDVPANSTLYGAPGRKVPLQL